MATSPSSGTSVVFDASALLRAFVDLEPEARRWVERVAAEEVAPAWPAHLYAEVANGLVRLIRAGSIDATRAAHIRAGVVRLPARVPAPNRVADALAIALERRLTVCDAAYASLAEGLNARLVTADRRLAEATERAVLLPG